MHTLAASLAMESAKTAPSADDSYGCSAVAKSGGDET
jgi:hypothetical protein